MEYIRRSHKLLTVVLIFTMISPISFVSAFQNYHHDMDVNQSSASNLDPPVLKQQLRLPQRQYSQQRSMEIIDNSKDDLSTKIILYHDFDARDQAVTTIYQSNPNSIKYKYDIIPAITVRGLAKHEIPQYNLRSISDSHEVRKSTNYDLTTEYSSVLTLNETAWLLGIQDLRRQYGLTGEGVTIAVLDSGVDDSLSEAFDDRLSVDVVDTDQLEGPRDKDGHGTHVTGIAASNGMYKIDGEWIQTESPGMAPNANVLSIRVLDEFGFGQDEWVIQGIEKAILSGADIISMSLSTTFYNGSGNDAMEAMVNQAYENGVILVAAAGNTGPIGSAIGMPAAFDNVISVGATTSFSSTDFNQEIWGPSGVGPAVHGYPGPDVVAHGTQILSLNLGDGTPRESTGTSMATPHVSGGVALLKEAFPSATFHEIREALVASANLVVTPTGFIDQVEAQGAGLVNFGIAYDILKDSLQDNPQTHLNMPIIPELVQDWNYVYFHRIVGTSKTLDFFIHSSRNVIVAPNLDTNLLHGYEILLPSAVNLTEGLNRISITSKVTAKFVERTVARIYFTENSTNRMLPYANITYDFSSSSFPQSNVLFDASHDMDTPGNYFAYQGAKGQFSQMYRNLEEEGHIVSENLNDPLSDSLLTNYDLLVMANPDNERPLQSGEISSIHDFLINDGKSMLLMISGGLFDAEGIASYAEFDRTSLNSLLAPTGINIPDDELTPYSILPCDYELQYETRIQICAGDAHMSSAQDIYNKLYTYPNYGPELEIRDRQISNEVEEVFPIAFQNNKLVAAGVEFKSKGRLIVFSSSLQFDNNGILYNYFGGGSAVDNQDILIQTFDWLSEPRQAYMEYTVNGDQVDEHVNLLMHKDATITFVPKDKDGNIIGLPSVINMSLVIQDVETGITEYWIYSVAFDPAVGGYYLPLAASDLNRNAEWDFYYSLNVSGSIPTDSHLQLNFQLKHFDSQQQIQSIGRVLFFIFMASWILWVINEGGTELKKRKEQNKQISTPTD